MEHITFEMDILLITDTKIIKKIQKQLRAFQPSLFHKQQLKYPAICKTSQNGF
jgi:hypothetical protein